MESIYKAPEYRVQVDLRMLAVRLYTPLCRNGTVSFLFNNRTAVINFYPHVVRFTIPEVFDGGSVETSYDDILGFFTVLILRNPQNREPFICNHIKNIVMGSFTGECFNGRERVPIFIGAHGTYTYGFLNRYYDRFDMWAREYHAVLELKDPECTSFKLRRYLRKIDESICYSYWHYIGDYSLQETVPQLFQYEPPWVQINSTFQLTAQERDIVERTRNYADVLQLLNASDVATGELQLIEVLLAYCYSKRVYGDTNGLATAWTIAKLSSILCWFDVHDNMRKMLLVFYRRAITYPVYRNWLLNLRVQNDVVSLLRAGKIAVAKGVSEIHCIFRNVAGYAIFNQLYITNLIHFSLFLEDVKYMELASQLESILIRKHEVRDDLLLSEAFYQMWMSMQTADSLPTDRLMTFIPVHGLMTQMRRLPFRRFDREY